MSEIQRESYADRLWEQTKTVYSQLQAARQPDERMSVLHEALKSVALESWKNGIEAGRRRASRSTERPASAKRPKA